MSLSKTPRPSRRVGVLCMVILVSASALPACELQIKGSRTSSDSTSSSTSNASRKRVFVTSTTHDGNFGGLAGADAYCQAAADSVSLDGTFKAWMSATAPMINAVDRIVDVAPWYFVDRTTLAVTTFSDLSTDGADVIIDRDEMGNNQSGERVWTGTRGTGLIATRFCNNWTSNGNSGIANDRGNAGKAGELGGSWTLDLSGPQFSSQDDCDQLNRLYCFEQ